MFCSGGFLVAIMDNNCENEDEINSGWEEPKTLFATSMDLICQKDKETKQDLKMLCGGKHLEFKAFPSMMTVSA